MKKLLCFVAALLCIGAAFGQTRHVSGVITSEKGEPISGVNIYVKEAATVGAISDAAGRYTVKNIPSNGKTLVFRFVGYITKEIPITGTTLNVKMDPDNQKIEELVVVGYGSARRVGTVVGSVSTVSSEKIKDRPTANVMDALQGKVAGLQVYTSSGEPSAYSSIKLHGVGSLSSSSEPLYVLDGVPVSNFTMRSLNPNDFESVNVLKDASATSIYGARAANGVILIVTKKGKNNQKGVINVNVQYGVSELATTKFFKSMMNTKQLTDFWVETGFRTRQQVDALLKKYPNDTKWYKYYYKPNTPSFQSDVSFSGGEGKTNYYISGSYFYQDGLAARSKYDRTTVRSNISTKVNSWLTTGMNLSGSIENTQSNPFGGNSVNRGLSLLAQPFYTPYDENGKKYPDLIPGWQRYNPDYLAEKNPSDVNKIQFNGTAFLQVSPIEGMVLKTQAGSEAYDNTTSSKRLPSYKPYIDNGQVYEDFGRNYINTITNTAEYTFNFLEDNKMTLLLGQEAIDSKYRGFSGSSEGQQDDRLVLLGQGPQNKNVSSGKSGYAFLSLFSRLDYNFSEKYFADLTVRRDGSSRFAKAKRYANFYSFGFMWNAKQESFLKDVDFLSALNLKLSYGTSGNSSIDEYKYFAMVGSNQYDEGSGFYLSSPGNPELQWEQQGVATLGIKFALYDRYRFNIELYNRRTSSMLVDVPIPYTTGFDTFTSNVGAMRNRGVDFSFDADFIKGNDFSLTGYLNFNYNKNEVVDLFQGNKYWVVPNTGICWAIGKPISFFQPIFAGIDPQDGRAMWYKPGADISSTTKKETSKDFVEADLLQNTGKAVDPPFTGGFGFVANWKGLSLNADFALVLGKYLINNDRYFFENPTLFTGYNQSNTVLDYWKKPGDVTTFPRYGDQFTQFDSRLIEDASFLRLKAVTLGYSLPKRVLSFTKFFSETRLYVTSRNLFTITKYTGPDPEVDSNLTLGTYPNTRQYSLGILLTF